MKTLNQMGILVKMISNYCHYCQNLPTRFEDQSSELYYEGEYKIERSFSSNDSSNDMLDSSTTSSLDYSALGPYVNVPDISPQKNSTTEQ